MANKYLKLIFGVVGLSLITACEEYVELEPPYGRDADEPFKAEFEYDQALVGAYDLLQTSYLNLWIGEIASDNSIAGGESLIDTPGLHQIDDMSHTPSNNELRQLWQYNYAGIARSNFLFSKRNDLDFEGKEQIYAQANFLRAYYYFQLVKHFGGVPLITDPITVDQAADFDRSSAEVVYSFIEEELKTAASILSYTVNEKGRVSKGAALALLGKVYVYQKKYDEAAQVLDQVINEGPYSLYPGNVYGEMFRVANEGNSEVVFDIQYTGEEGGSYGCFVCLEGFLAPGFHSIRGYDGPVYDDGNSYNLPTQDLVDAFGPGDPRLEASVLDIEAFIASQGGGIEYVIGGGGHTGYYNNKYIKREGETGQPDNDLTSPLNHIIIRYADVLLMAAEAHALKPATNDGQASTYLNQVRTRVGLPEVDATGQALVDAIFEERRLEFAGEGLRFFDLVRSGKAAQEIEGFVSGKHELFPIPQAEIDLSGAGWQQNPEY